MKHLPCYSGTGRGDAQCAAGTRSESQLSLAAPRNAGPAVSRAGAGYGLRMDGPAFLHETASLVRRGWCAGADARDGLGFSTTASDPAATSWSLLGALVAVSERPEADMKALGDALWGISGVIPDESLDDWNNVEGRTQADTLQMLAQAESSLRDQPPPRIDRLPARRPL